MPKILALVSSKIFPPRMGGQKGIALFYQYLSSYCNVYMAACRSEVSLDGLPYPAQKLIHPNKLMPLNIFALLKLSRWIRSEGIQCIVAEHSYTGWMAYWLSKRCSVPFILHSHNIEAARFRQMGRWWWRFYEYYESWVHQRATHSFFISKEDRSYALHRFGLNNQKCHVAPYGVEHCSLPNIDKQAYKQKLGISQTTVLLYFNGTLDYKPNADAVQVLIRDVAPRLAEKLPDFKILITGSCNVISISETLSASNHFIYAGLVDDVAACYAAADVFLNPVVNNSGVKTKVVEALAHNCSVVSVQSGAVGIPPALYAGKLIAVEDNDWCGFSNAVLKAVSQPGVDTPPSFYNYFYWDAIAQTATLTIKEVIEKNG